MWRSMQGSGESEEGSETSQGQSKHKASDERNVCSTQLQKRALGRKGGKRESRRV